jgi:DNA-binding CsgD family transcriptional regulator
MSPDTVKSHLSHIFTKLGINKRAQLAVHVASHKK